MTIHPSPPKKLQTLLIKRHFLRIIALFLQDCQLSIEPAFLKSQPFLTISIVVLCTGPVRYAFCIIASRADWDEQLGSFH